MSSVQLVEEDVETELGDVVGLVCWSHKSRKAFRAASEFGVVGAS